MRPTGEHARFSPHLLENAKKAPAPWCVGCAALYQGRSPPSGRHVTQMVWDEKCLRRGASPSFGRNGVQGVITRSETASLRVFAVCTTLMGFVCMRIRAPTKRSEERSGGKGGG